MMTAIFSEPKNMEKGKAGGFLDDVEEANLWRPPIIREKMSDRLEVHLEHDIDEQYQYEPGEILRGCVSVYFPEPTFIKHITVQIKGEATVGWEDKSHEKFRAHETYINVIKKLIASSPNNRRQLEKGTHDFPFQYELPSNIPSSFIGKQGSVTYVVKATLQEDRGMSISPIIISEPFLVLRHMDISNEIGLLQPFHCEVSRRQFGIFCITGKVHVSLSINRRVHLPGEDIFLTVEVSNNSPRIVKALQASILMVSRFSAKHQALSHSQLVNKKRDEWEMSIGEGRRWRNVRLTIPPYVPESRLDGCDIIDISYSLDFTVEVDNAKPIRLSIPLLIGTDGIDKELQNLHPSHLQEVQDEKIQRPLMYRPTDKRENGHVRSRPPRDEEVDLPPPPRRRGSQESINSLKDIAMNDFEYDEKKFHAPLQEGETKVNPVYKHSAHERRPSWGTWVSTKTEFTKL
ncbi:arrestin domain-containing protein 4 isoform X1 [Lingula anatina]|uniref:Arrestin domain-containing protein 4 isoform X1 n=2 Tax=Lingula anatina TaxID=7574 RepID=A0A1S3JG41_LINAN|nr:arrestin domain-containing protein 4 isoform X1 [Lingula anatina]|eukprot:XP_013409375.1 arrestin domain-containing protein 4 isoform X1 [Lingula anatina]